MPTYVISTRTGDEARAKYLIEETTSNAHIYIPQKVVSRRYQGAWHEEKRILFPGFIMVETDDIRAFIKTLSKPFFKIYRKVFGKNEGSYWPISEEEQTWLRKLTGGDLLLVAMSKGLKEGRKVRFTDGPLVGCEPFVKKIDRHHRSVFLEIPMFGQMRTIKVSAEIVNGVQVVTG